MKNVFVMFFLTVSLLYSQSTILTLEESLELGLKNSKNLKLANSKMEYSKQISREYNSLFFPKLNFSASYARLSDVKSFEVNLPALPQPITIQDPVLNNYNFQLSLRQPLFTGFRILSSKRMADLNSKAVSEDYQKELNETAMQIRMSFWNYYKLKNLLIVLEENLNRINEHLEDTKRFLENGLVTRNDMLKLQVLYSTTELKKIEAQNQSRIARAMFNKSIGFNLNEDTDIKVEDVSIGQFSYSYQELIDEAIQNRHELSSLKYKVDAAGEAVNVAKSTWFPSVYLFGDLYYNRPNQRILPLEDKFYDTWALGVSLSWDVWTWGYNSSKVEQAQQQKYQTETTLKMFNENIELEVYRNYLNLTSELEKVNVNKENVEQSEENYRITVNKYEQQLATSSDLIDAEVSLLESKTNLTTSFVDYELARLRLFLSLGRKIY